MIKIELRPQRVSDAKRIMEILTNPNFKFVKTPESLEKEKEFLKENIEKNKRKEKISFSIIYEGKLVGACDLSLNKKEEMKHIGEIGYFVDEKYWGKGIATEVVKRLEKIGFEKFKLRRIVINMDPRNKASEKIAIKCGYKKEGTVRKAWKKGDEFMDSHIYTKVI